MYDHNYVKATYSINRRNFLATIGATYGTLAVPWLEVDAAESNQPTPGRKHGANVRAVFLYPPSATFSNDPDGWWSWPGNEFDAEGRQKRYTAALKEIEKRLGMKITTENQSVANNKDAQGQLRKSFFYTTKPKNIGANLTTAIIFSMSQGSDSIGIQNAMGEVPEVKPSDFYIDNLFTNCEK